MLIVASGRFDTVVLIVVASYAVCHLLLSTVLTIRGLSSKEMGLMGLINHGIWVACEEDPMCVCGIM